MKYVLVVAFTLIPVVSFARQLMEPGAGPQTRAACLAVKPAGSHGIRKRHAAGRCRRIDHG